MLNSKRSKSFVFWWSQDNIAASCNEIATSSNGITTSTVDNIPTSLDFVVVSVADNICVAVYQVVNPIDKIASSFDLISFSCVEIIIGINDNLFILSKRRFNLEWQSLHDLVLGQHRTRNWVRDRGRWRHRYWWWHRWRYCNWCWRANDNIVLFGWDRHSLINKLLILIVTVINFFLSQIILLFWTWLILLDCLCRLWLICCNNCLGYVGNLLSWGSVLLWVVTEFRVIWLGWGRRRRTFLAWSLRVEVRDRWLWRCERCEFRGLLSWSCLLTFIIYWVKNCFSASITVNHHLFVIPISRDLD